MPGAIALAADSKEERARALPASARRGASESLPASIVELDTAPVNDERIGCLSVGPGLGDIPQLLTLALTSKAPKVIDADGGGRTGEPERLMRQDAIVTPHDGEFRRLFAEVLPAGPSPSARSRRRSGGGRSWWFTRDRARSITSPDRRLSLRAPAPAWLATAGTGDVLAGTIAAMRARGLGEFERRPRQPRLSAAREELGDRRTADDRRRSRRGGGGVRWRRSPSRLPLLGAAAVVRTKVGEGIPRWSAVCSRRFWRAA